MNKIPFITFLMVLSLFLFPFQTQAICEGQIVPCGGSGNPCTFCHIFVLLNNILSFILTCLAPIISGLMLMIGGFYFLAAGPSPEKVTQAKSILTATIIGLVIILASWVFLNTFLTGIGVAEWTGLGTWWKIQCP
ncbi:MAG: pilin [Candidatus Nealsonbacteria bacterium]